MADPTKDAEFKRVLGNLIKMKPKPHSKLQVENRKSKTVKKPAKRGASAKAKTA